MKKIAIIIASFAILSGNSAFAQDGGKQIGKGAQAGTYSSSDQFAWGIGIGGLAILGTMVGIVAGTSSQGQSNFSH